MDDRLEKSFLAKDLEVKENLKKIDELTNVSYVERFEDKVGFFPKLENLENRPVLARFSYGKDAPNMSAVYFDSSKGESELTGERNVRDFLDSQGFINYPDVIQVQGKFEGTELQIEEVSKDTLKDKQKVVGNVIFTRDPNITLIIKPADCPVAVIYAKDSNGNDLVAIDHSGADAINAGLTRQGLWYLQDELGVDLSTVQIAVTPGVSQKNYFITNEPERRGNGIIERNWGEHITAKISDDSSEKRYVDILSAFEMQALQAGVKAENIQAFRVDTYEDASKGIAFSRRYSSEHNNQHMGGQVVAIKLNNS
jgi:copper oxidase (laccase) domain-containing protein